MTEDLTAARLARGSIYLTLQNVFSALIAVVGFAFEARVITEEEMGVIAGLALLTSLVQLGSDFGLNTSIPKHVAELRGKAQDISDVVVSAIAFRTPVCIGLASTLLILASGISTVLFKTAGYAPTVALLSLDAVLLSLTPLLNNVLLGAGKLKSIAVYNTISIVARWLSIAALLLANQRTYGIILGWITGDAVLLFMLIFAVTRLAAFSKETFAASRKQIPKLLKFALPLYLAAAVSFLYTYYDKALILAYLPLSDLGIYSTTYLAFTVLATIAGALGSALLPFYGTAYGRSDHKAIASGMKRAGKYTALVIFPLALGLMAASRPTLTLFAGSRYEVGWPALAALSLFGLVYGMSPALSNLLLIYGKTRMILLLSFVPVISSLMLLPLIWTFGLLGLAIMRGTSIALSFALTAHFINRTVKVQLDKKALTRGLAASALMATVIIAMQRVFYSTYLLPLYVLVGAIVYIILIRTLNVLDQEDFQLLRQIIGKRAASYAARILRGHTQP